MNERAGVEVGLRAYAASKTTALYMKGLNQAETMIFVRLYVLWFQRQLFFLKKCLNII